MEKKIREKEKFLGDKADEIREEIWQKKERYAEHSEKSINLVKNEKIKEN